MATVVHPRCAECWIVEDIGTTRLEDALDYASGVEHGNNFGGQSLTEFLVRGFSPQEFYRNGFAVNRGYSNMPDAGTREAWSSIWAYPGAPAPCRQASRRCNEEGRSHV